MRDPRNFDLGQLLLQAQRERWDVTLADAYADQYYRSRIADVTLQPGSPDVLHLSFEWTLLLGGILSLDVLEIFGQPNKGPDQMWLAVTNKPLTFPVFHVAWRDYGVVAFHDGRGKCLLFRPPEESCLNPQTIRDLDPGQHDRQRRRYADFGEKRHAVLRAQFARIGPASVRPRMFN